MRNPECAKHEYPIETFLSLIAHSELTFIRSTASSCDARHVTQLWVNIQRNISPMVAEFYGWIALEILERKVFGIISLCCVDRELSTYEVTANNASRPGTAHSVGSAHGIGWRCFNDCQAMEHLREMFQRTFLPRIGSPYKSVIVKYEILKNFIKILEKYVLSCFFSFFSVFPSNGVAHFSRIVDRLWFMSLLLSLERCSTSLPFWMLV